MSHLRNELDQIIVSCGTAAAPLLQGAMRPLVSRLRALRRALLPLPKLVKNQLNIVKTAVESTVGAAEAAYAASPPPKKAAAVAAVGEAQTASPRRYARERRLPRARCARPGVRHRP